VIRNRQESPLLAGFFVGEERRGKFPVAKRAVTPMVDQKKMQVDSRVLRGILKQLMANNRVSSIDNLIRIVTVTMGYTLGIEQFIRTKEAWKCK